MEIHSPSKNLAIKVAKAGVVFVNLVYTFPIRLAALIVVGLHMLSAGITPVRQHRKVRQQV